MIRMIQSKSASHAKAYFSDALTQSDYYISDYSLDEQELQGKLQGKLAQRLGITGVATKYNFFALCENRNPATGQTLTQRQKEDRTTGYDINFHCPKSVSIVHALSSDDHILKAFEASVQDTMLQIEADSKTRIRKQGENKERSTGELIWANFVHQTARPVEGAVPDPHLHAHCFVFNSTWDETEKQLKAGQFRDIKRDMPYYQAQFHKQLSDRLMQLGYAIEGNDKSFEIKGVPKDAMELFSKRTNEIGRVAREKGITNAKELSELGARTRHKKQKGMSMQELKTAWRKQLREMSDSKENPVIRFDKERAKEKISPKQCIDHALLHGFERASVLEERKLLTLAFRYSLGKGVTEKEITEQFYQDDRLIRVKERGSMLITTREVLAEEKRMVSLARQGQGMCKPLYSKAPALKLEGEQAAAVSHILTTPHRVSIVRGAAGTGKTTLMKEAVHWMEKANKQVFVVAPTAQTSRGVLRQEGFAQADTVAQLLQDKKKQETLYKQVLWVDEAGLLGTKDMTALLELVTRQDARLILGGDTRQHASVVRGDALRILSSIAGIKSAEVSKIYRQQNTAYKKAIECLSKGNTKAGFEQLDTIGYIKTTASGYKNLVEDYMGATKKGKSVLVISPTREQGEVIAEAIRTELQAKKRLGKKEVTVPRLININLTEAEKKDWRNFKKAAYVQFSQHSTGIKRGSIWQVNKSDENGVWLQDEKGKAVLLPFEKSKDYQVYEQSELKLAKGDKIRVTRNGFDEKEKRLNNGQLLEVEAVSKKGHIRLKNPTSKSTYTVRQDFRHIAYAYCLTSHASQGKTVDEVLVWQPAATFPATDAKQFYVSLSRGRERACVYTDSKEELLYHALESGDRQSALELTDKNKTKDAVIKESITKDMVEHGIREQEKTTALKETVTKETTQEKQSIKDKQSPVKDYEL